MSRSGKALQLLLPPAAARARRPGCRSGCRGFRLAGWGVAALFLLLMLLLLSCRLPETPAGEGNHNGAADESEGADPAIVTYPSGPAPGDFAMLAVGPCPTGSEVRLETGKGITQSPPYRHGDSTYFIIGVGFQVSPGKQSLALYLEEPGGRRREISGELNVAGRVFQTSRFSVPVKWTGKEAARRLPGERERVRLALMTTEPAPLWHQPFIMPLESRISSEYGAVRVINEGAPTRHNGLDIAANTGAPVMAANDGIVRLAAPLLAQGNMVIIDHGMNLSSSYLHLDSIEVKEGEHVKRGQIIGRVGETGFASGPHLHWEVNLGLAPVNPLQLVQGDLFYLPAPAVTLIP